MLFIGEQKRQFKILLNNSYFVETKFAKKTIHRLGGHFMRAAKRNANFYSSLIISMKWIDPTTNTYTKEERIRSRKLDFVKISSAIIRLANMR